MRNTNTSTRHSGGILYDQISTKCIIPIILPQTTVKWFYDFLHAWNSRTANHQLAERPGHYLRTIYYKGFVLLLVIRTCVAIHMQLISNIHVIIIIIILHFLTVYINAGFIYFWLIRYASSCPMACSKKLLPDVAQPRGDYYYYDIDSLRYIIKFRKVSMIIYNGHAVRYCYL
jgi:hypothetical protein